MFVVMFKMFSYIKCRDLSAMVGLEDNKLLLVKQSKRLKQI